MQLNNRLFYFVASVVPAQIKKSHFNLQSKEGGWKCATPRFLGVYNAVKYFEHMCTSTI